MKISTNSGYQYARIYLVHRFVMRYLIAEMSKLPIGICGISGVKPVATRASKFFFVVGYGKKCENSWLVPFELEVPVSGNNF